MSERAQQLRLVEALLFAAPSRSTRRLLARHLDDAADVAGLLRELAESYAGRGVNLVRLAGGWAFRTAPDLAAKLRIERPVARKLSRAAVETLAVIAYHQPVTRAEIEEIRGVALGKGTIDTLMEAGWVRPRGRRASPGRPLLWVTTPGFLVHFGLDSSERAARSRRVARRRSSRYHPGGSRRADERDWGKHLAHTRRHVLSRRTVWASFREFQFIGNATIAICLSFPRYRNSEPDPKAYVRIIIDNHRPLSEPTSDAQPS